MKKYLMTFAAAVCCAMSATVFTACGDDDNNSSSGTGGGGTVADTIPASVSIKMSFSETEDMLKYCDVVVKYNDGTGEKTDSVKATAWTKTLSSKLPATLTFKKIITVRDSAGMASNEKITFYTGSLFTYAFYNKTNDIVGGIRTNGIMGRSTAEDVPEFIKTIKEGEFNETETFAFDAAGKQIKNSETATDSTKTKPAALR